MSDPLWHARRTQRVEMQIARKAWPALVLNGVAGFVDVVGYVALRQVFTASMTGNTLAVARGVAGGDRGHASRRGVAIPIFVAGMIVSRLVVQRAERRRRAAPACLLYGIEAALLAAMVLVGERAIQGDRISTSAAGSLLPPPHPPRRGDGPAERRAHALRAAQRADDARDRHAGGALRERCRYLIWPRDETRGRFPAQIREALAP